jgi:hypothetical protein
MIAYFDAYNGGDEERKSQVLRWFRGEYATKTEAKRELGINLIISDDNWYDFIKLFSSFLKKAGYSGFLVLVDELVNIFRIPHAVTRQYNYEKILMMYNDMLQGRGSYMGIIMCATPECMEDQHRGIFSYDALRSRLAEGRFNGSGGAKDLLAPIIRLEPLTYEEMYVLMEKLSQIHAGLYGYTSRLQQDNIISFLKTEYGRVGADTHITPREIIRDFIELVDILYQDPEASVESVLNGENFDFNSGEAADSDDFAGFEI